MYDLCQITDPPPIDAVRPAYCPYCGAGAGLPGSLSLWGHGKRPRDVVVPGARKAPAWVRRFRNTRPSPPHPCD
jgi:hypothetical protein